MKEKRTKIWIDRFQTSLMLRITSYFAIYQAAVWSLVALEQMITQRIGVLLGPRAAFSCAVFLIATVVILGFLFILDSVRASHRLVGPLYRFRQTIKAITAGEEIQRVRLRQGDFLLELRDDFNEMLEVLEQRGAIVLKKESYRHGPPSPCPGKPPEPCAVFLAEGPGPSESGS